MWHQTNFILLKLQYKCNITVKLTFYFNKSPIFSLDLTLSLLAVTSADNLYKQFWPQSGWTECRSWSGSKLFDNTIVLMKIFWKNLILKKSAEDNKSMKLWSVQGIKNHIYRPISSRSKITLITQFKTSFLLYVVYHWTFINLSTKIDLTSQLI